MSHLNYELEGFVERGANGFHELHVRIPSVVSEEMGEIKWKNIGESERSKFIYRRHVSGLAEFFAAVAPDCGGFGGQQFTWKMDDDSILRGGAWSSRAGVINYFLKGRAFGRHSIVNVVGRNEYDSKVDCHLCLRQTYALINKWWDGVDQDAFRQDGFDWKPVLAHRWDKHEEVEWQIMWMRSFEGDMLTDRLYKSPDEDSECFTGFDWNCITDDNDAYLRYEC